jgi:hypothetical protein
MGCASWVAADVGNGLSRAHMSIVGCLAGLNTGTQFSEVVSTAHLHCLSGEKKLVFTTRVSREWDGWKSYSG